MRSRCILKVILDWTDVFSGEYLLPTNVPNVFLNNKFLSWRFQMMNLNLPSEFSALNFCFDLTVTLCSIPKWNLLKILSRTRISSWTKKNDKNIECSNCSRKTSAPRFGIYNFPKKWQNKGLWKELTRVFTWLDFENSTTFTGIRILLKYIPFLKAFVDLEFHF